MENMKKTFVKEIIRQVYRGAARAIGEENLFGVFLYGSQNYNLDTKNSDIDLTLVFIPDIQDVLIKSHISKPAPVTFTSKVTTHWTSLPDFIHSICYKPSLSSIEYLCSPYEEINPLYWEEWICSFVVRADEILRGNLSVFVHNLKGQAFHYLSVYQNSEAEDATFKALSRYLLITKVLSRIAKGEAISFLILQTNEVFLKQTLEIQACGFNTEEAKSYLEQWICKTEWERLPSQEERIKKALYLIMEMKKNDPQSHD